MTGAVVSFLDVMRQLNDGREEHYVEVTEIAVDRPPEIHLTETTMEITGKLCPPPPPNSFQIDMSNKSYNKE